MDATVGLEPVCGMGLAWVVGSVETTTTSKSQVIWHGDIEDLMLYVMIWRFTHNVLGCIFWKNWENSKNLSGAFSHQFWYAAWKFFLKCILERYTWTSCQRQQGVGHQQEPLLEYKDVRADMFRTQANIIHRQGERVIQFVIKYVHKGRVYFFSLK